MRTWTARTLSALLLSLLVPAARAAEIPVEGRVLDDHGDALAGAGVELLPVLSSSGGRSVRAASTSRVSRPARGSSA